MFVLPSILILLLGVVVGACAMALYRDRQENIKTMQELRREIELLKEANKKRLPYRSAEEIEHGLAALDVFIREFEFEKSVLDNAVAHFQKARNNE